MSISCANAKFSKTDDDVCGKALTACTCYLLFTLLFLNLCNGDLLWVAEKHIIPINRYRTRIVT